MTERSPNEDRAFAELRQLIVGPEQDTLAALRERVEDRQRRIEDVGEVLPEAAARCAEDAALAKALAPAVEDALITSVRANPNTLADVLFPVMGPAIRKSLAQFLATMLEGMNRTLEQSFSLQGLMWRWEAFRTGKSFAEVVLLHTLVYRTEQAFLIHRTTGLPLLHVAAPEVRDQAQDADMVSGMLTAIRDFVQDAFRDHASKDSVGGESLDALRVGELEVWVEQGPLAVLAGVIRGAAPKELHTVFQETLEHIHARYGKALAAFEGDTAPFAAAQPDLEHCLKSGYRREARRRLSPALAVVLLLVGTLVAWGAVSTFTEARRWQAYVTRLRAEPGLLIVTERTGWRTHSVSGLRDPMARNPFELMAENGIDPARVDSRWEAFQAAEPAFVLRRARDVLQPPSTLELTFGSGVLRARGAAEPAWVTQARMVSKLIPGVSSFEYESPFEVLVARPRVSIENCRLYFPHDGTTPLEDQRCGWERLLADVRELAGLAAAAGRRVRLSVVGYADITGSDQPNLLLSRARAESVRASIVAAAVPGVEVVAVGRGARRSVESRTLADDRYVTFRVEFDEPAAPQAAASEPK
jgi:OmpA family protein